MPFTAIDVSRRELFFVSEKATIAEVAKKMLDKKIGSVLVEAKGGPGLISINDILALVSKKQEISGLTAGKIMKPLKTVDAGEKLEALLHKFATHGTERLGVVDAGEIVGVVKKSVVDRLRNAVEKTYHTLGWKKEIEKGSVGQ